MFKPMANKKFALIYYKKLDCWVCPADKMAADLSGQWWRDWSMSFNFSLILLQQTSQLIKKSNHMDVCMLQNTNSSHWSCFLFRPCLVLSFWCFQNIIWATSSVFIVYMEMTVFVSSFIFGGPKSVGSSWRWCFWCTRFLTTETSWFRIRKLNAKLVPGFEYCHFESLSKIWLNICLFSV